VLRCQPDDEVVGRSPDGIAPSPLVVHFRIVDPVKAPELLIESFAITKRAVPDAHLAFVGPVSDALVATLTELTFALGMSSSVHFTGSLSAADYRNWLSPAMSRCNCAWTSMANPPQQSAPVSRLACQRS